MATKKTKSNIINWGKLINERKINITQFKKFTNTTLKNMVRSGKGSDVLNPFIKSSKSILKTLSSGKKLTKSQTSKIANFIAGTGRIYNKNDYTPNQGWITKFNTLKYTKLTRFAKQENVSNYTFKLLKQNGISQRDINLIKFRSQNQEDKKGLEELEKMVESSNPEIYDIILGMGKGNFKNAYQDYPEDVTRLINDYLGLNIEDWVD